jgi:hypothetical protein
MVRWHFTPFRFLLFLCVFLLLLALASAFQWLSNIGYEGMG